MRRRWWILIVCLLFVYFSGVLAFSGHFLYGDHLDGQDVFYKTSMDLSIEMTNRTRNRTITIYMPDGATEVATFDQLGITRVGDLQSASKLTSPFIWPISFFTERYYTTDNALSYNETTLLNAVSRLGCVSAGNLAPTDAYVVKTEDGDYQIVPDMIGTQIDIYKLKDAIVASLADASYDVDLLEDGCYALADVREDDENLLNLKEQASSFKETQIELDLGDGTSIQVPKDVLNDIGNVVNGRFTIDEDKVREYVVSLCKKYNTRGQPRTFHTSTGETVVLEDVLSEDRTVCHLSGWLLDDAGLYDLLIEALRSGRNAEITVPWIYKSVAHGEDNDFGDTYVEISIKDQHLWFVENGVCTADANVITGTRDDPSRATPTGMYRTTDLYTEHTMTGSYGSAFCHYFIRVTLDGVGIHDSSWRSSYGGNIYVNDGSHGCINTPYETVDYIFNVIKNRDVYTPIIIW